MPDERVYDVCLLLEGTYPYVSGGVSSWIHALIKAMPDLQFTAVCILPSSKEKWTPRYEVPENFSNWQTVYLHDPISILPKRMSKVSKGDMGFVRSFHGGEMSLDLSAFPEMLRRFRSGSMPLYNLMHGKAVWDFIVESYDPDTNDDSFIDFFWTYRISHLPIFKMLTYELPKAKMYHTVSTGYAGLLGVVAQHTTNRPLVLTEHGIYFKERKIEISQADWIFDNKGRRMRVDRRLGSFQAIWINLFHGLSKLTYDAAAQIVTLYEGNRQQQILDGAPPEKTSVIPNGISLTDYLPIAESRVIDNSKELISIGFVGRVVPIKDVKTFLRACKIVHMRWPEIEVLIMGPTEEDEEYYKECSQLVTQLELESVVTFTGKVDMLEYFPRLDIMALTSISEAQPLVLLEANCAGIPTVATNVGACSELLLGRTEEDKALGPSGIITNSADPLDTARGMLKLIENPELRRRMANSGVARVKTYYREEDMFAAYHEFYSRHGAAQDVTPER